jgi:fucose permease
VTSPTPLARPLLAFGSVTFALLGGLQAAYGPLFGAWQARYLVSSAEVGAVLSAHFAAAFVGVLLAGAAPRLIGYPATIGGALALSALGNALLAWGPGWWWVPAGAALLGFGHGLAAVVVNFLTARLFAARATGAVSLLAGSFGIGAVAGPTAVGFAAARGVDPLALPALLFGVGAPALLLLAIAFLRLRGWPPATTRGVRAPGDAGTRIAIAFALLFFAYVGLEASTAAWAPTHVGARSGAAAGAFAASLFWIALTAARFAVAAIGDRLRSAHLLLIAAAVALAGGILALAGVQILGYVLLGVGCAPVFPTTVVWMQRVFGPRAERIGAIVLATGNLGPVAFGPAIGFAVAVRGEAVIPLILTATAATLLALVAALAFALARSRAAGLAPVAR